MKQIFLAVLVLCTLLSADFSREDNIKVVTDNVTKLQWQDDDILISKRWEEAISYCENLIFAGKDDWRLPNFNELNSIVDRGERHPSINSAFKNTSSQYYLTSTTLVANEKYALSIMFDYGSTTYSTKTNTDYVRCVRAGQ